MKTRLVNIFMVLGFILLLHASYASTEERTPTPRIDHECSRIAKKLSSVGYKECLNRNLQRSTSVSVNGAPILFKEYPPLKSREPMGRVLLIGGTHGDEYSSVSVVFKWLKMLDQFHSGLFHWHVFPLMNPDGLLKKKSSRTNANGVDLNRNFPTRDWKAKSEHYWIVRTNKNPRRYPGTHPLSEPESRWLYSEINDFKPDVIIAVHAPHGIVDFNHNGATDAPNKLGRLHLNLLGTYPGSLGNFAGIQRSIPVLTIELEYAGIMPSPREVNDIWIDMIRWLRQNLPVERPGEPVDLEEELRLAQGKEIKIDEIDEIENIF
ncbi:MAG: murein peptide amidase A [Proteobacteria bacterium]|nr:murein peptide amidase A [Pseudomonadota bacterium]